MTKIRRTKRNNLFLTLSILLALPAVGCQSIESLFIDAPPPVKEVQTVPPPTADPDAPTEAAATLPVASPTDTPIPAATQPETLTEPAKPTTSVEDTGDFYINPAGYRFENGAGWSVTDYFGQTVVTNDPAVLASGSLGENQTLLLFIAGSLSETGEAGQSAETLMQETMLDVIAPFVADGILSPLSAVETVSQANASGVKGTHLISRQTGDLYARSNARIRGDLYVVGVGVMRLDDRPALESTVSQMLGSTMLTADRFNANASSYGLSQPELALLDQDLGGLLPLPSDGTPIPFGATEGQVEANQLAVYQFSAEGASAITLNVIPLTAEFDVVINIVDSGGVSILPDGVPLDSSLAGSAEVLSNFSLTADGPYRLVVRGFALSGGRFRIELVQQ